MQANFVKRNCDKSDMLLIGPTSLTPTAKDLHLKLDFLYVLTLSVILVS